MAVEQAAQKVEGGGGGGGGSVLVAISDGQQQSPVYLCDELLKSGRVLVGGSMCMCSWAPRSRRELCGKLIRIVEISLLGTLGFR